jgi:membrane protease YdiL (CAAX protease family)
MTRARAKRLAAVVAVYALLASASALVASAVAGRNVWRLSEGPAGPPLSGALLGLLAAGVILLTSAAAERWWASFKSARDTAAARLGSASLLECLVLAAASTAGEELFIRGLLLPAVGLFASSLVFAALHFSPRSFRPGPFLFLLLTGVLLGWCARWHGDLTPAVVAHFLVNFYRLLALRQPDRAPAPASRSDARPRVTPWGGGRSP